MQADALHINEICVLTDKGYDNLLHRRFSSSSALHFFPTSGEKRDNGDLREFSRGDVSASQRHLCRVQRIYVASYIGLVETRASVCNRKMKVEYMAYV